MIPEETADNAEGIDAIECGALVTGIGAEGAIDSADVCADEMPVIALEGSAELVDATLLAPVVMLGPSVKLESIALNDADPDAVPEP